MWQIHRNICGRIGRSIRVHQHRTNGTNTPENKLDEVGRLAEKSESRYKPGQIFLHRVFAYRGIVICRFECREFGNKDHESNQYDVASYYQVLVHSGDWKEMRFSPDMTTFINSSNDGPKTMSSIQGMDCVRHDDILPISLLIPTGDFRPPFEHNLFKRLFELVDKSRPELGYHLTPDFSGQRAWLAPISTHIETTNSVRVMITIYYLGQSSHNLNPGKHCWRYVVRMENLESSNVLLRERQIKVFSLNNLTQASGGGVVGSMPRLTRDHPAFQFSSVVDVAQQKAGHLWGKLKFEREDKSSFDVNIPTVLLECNPEFKTSEANEENVVQ